MDTTEIFNTKKEAKDFSKKQSAKGLKTISTTKNSNGQFVLKIEQAFKKFTTPEEGVQAHIDFLINNPRYAKAGVLDAATPEDQAKALKSAGYATDPYYAERLVSVLDNTVRKQFPEYSQNQSKGETPASETKIERYINLSVKAKGGAQNLTNEEMQFLMSVDDENSDNYISPKERIMTDADIIIAAGGDYSVVDAAKVDAIKETSSFATGDAETTKDAVTGEVNIEAVPGDTTSPKDVAESIANQKEQLELVTKPEDTLDVEVTDPLEGQEVEDIEEEDKIEDLLAEVEAEVEKEETKVSADKQEKMRKAEKVLSGLKAAAGILSLSKALRDPEIETPELSPLITEAVEKQRQLSKSGLTAAEKAAAMSNLDSAYAGAMKNVLRASGGQRGMFLAGQGVVNAQRIKGLNELAAQDAAVRQQNVQQYNALAASVGQMQLQRDMSVEQMKQATIQKNRDVLGGIGTNLVSDAISDVSWYLNPNRDLIEQAQRTNLEGLAGKNRTPYDTSKNATVGLASTDPNATMTEEEKLLQKQKKQTD